MNLRNKKGEFGIIYTKFKNKPKKAISHLRKVKEGECINALYRKEIGFVSIVWGKEDTEKENGFGLAHIIQHHENELKQLGLSLEDFITIAFIFGKIDIKKDKAKIHLDGEMFRLIISTEYKKEKKLFLITAYDLRPIKTKNPKRLKSIKK